MTTAKPATRIQRRNRETIREAALDVFSQHGFRGATLDQIAQAAGLSKPNLLYYFPSKEAIHVELLAHLMTDWLEPLRALDATGDPVEEIVAYVLRKLDMSREMPRESRLFANEIVQGAPRIMELITSDLRPLVDEKAGVIAAWAQAGKIAPVDPYHLIFSIWSTTQHYADFDIQVRGVLGVQGSEHFDDARAFLTHLYTSALAPARQGLVNH
ncbi:TetR family transcriptional regulator C-terminal domain-containing protein [Maritimibacter sp. UBA3975]|uniref:TetR family transcriptional regulator C-terminal domain-containing protein n=1 Tax=Maritimibacter sp. UBA3975 TaxID=1946833 RepID=UPI000C0B0368|nr:TetR family transcriptional regulator C-terminal domain-containing protein [Maritimibacter sp. UBA3975]MAM61501.1 TetR family transcriptional regulator [Maritimibacter sp.]|tara:strand:+ start:26150 stop:26788 length:639 start_codon:yes stop_codon:yes gene_type:complete